MRPLEGHLLIAAPDLLDPNFARTVVLLLKHDDEGSWGVVLNRPSETELTSLAGRIFDDDFHWDKPIHLGGPVGGPLTVFHGIADLADREVVAGVYQTLDATKVQEVLSRKPEPSLVVANCAGWAAGQLDDELAEDSWLTLPARAEHLLGGDRGDLWLSTMSEARGRGLVEMLRLRVVPADPRWN